MAGVKTVDLPSAASLASVLGNEIVGGGELRTAQLAWAAFEAAILAAAAGIVRERLTANRTYYVRTDGSDDNDGLADSAGGAFLTLQKAIDTVQALDLAGFDVTIEVGDGTYTAAVAGAPWVGDGTVTIDGNSGSPGNVIVSTTSADAIVAQDGASLVVQGLEVRTTTSGHGLAAYRGGTVRWSNVRFGACATAHIAATDGGMARVGGSYEIVGNAASHFYAARGGLVVNVSSPTVTVTGTPAFSTAFAFSEDNGGVVVPGLTFSGSATGARYSANKNSVVVTGGAGASYFPGDAAGSVTNGARYDTDIGTTYESQQGVAVATLTDAATIAWNAETQQAAKVTLGGNRTLGAIANPRAGFTYILIVVQDGTGSRTLDLSDAIYKFPGGTEPTLSTAAGAIDVLSFVFDGTSMLGAIQKGFA
jgi:hypothetical protein